MDAARSTAVMPVTGIGKGTGVTPVTAVTRNDMTTEQRITERYDAANPEAALVILADTAKYGGEGSHMVIWARLVIERSEAPPADGEAGRFVPAEGNASTYEHRALRWHKVACGLCWLLFLLAHAWELFR